MLDPDPLYRIAKESPKSASGFYNKNVRLDTAEGPIIVRIPIQGADGMDLKIWREEAVIRGVTPWVDAVPSVLHVSSEPIFQVHGFISGDVVDQVAPRGHAVPLHLIDDVVRFFQQMTRVPTTALPPLPEQWPKEQDTAAFGRRLADVTAGVWSHFQGPYSSLYEALGVPGDPLRAVGAAWRSMTPRPFSALHCDVHRKNLIISAGRTFFLDWELSLWGDPVYDLAVHIHKMDYALAEQNRLVTSWLAAMPSGITAGVKADLETYRGHERVKSAIVDAVRYSKLLSSPGEPTAEKRLVDSFTRKINRAHAVWGTGRTLEQDEVRRILTGGQTKPA